MPVDADLGGFGKLERPTAFLEIITPLYDGAGKSTVKFGSFAWAKAIFQIVKIVYNAGMLEGFAKFIWANLSCQDAILLGVTCVAQIGAAMTTDGVSLILSMVVQTAAIAEFSMDTIQMADHCAVAFEPLPETELYFRGPSGTSPWTGCKNAGTKRAHFPQNAVECSAAADALGLPYEAANKAVGPLPPGCSYPGVLLNGKVHFAEGDWLSQNIVTADLLRGPICSKPANAESHTTCPTAPTGADPWAGCTGVGGSKWRDGDSSLTPETMPGPMTVYIGITCSAAECITEARAKQCTGVTYDTKDRHCYCENSEIASFPVHVSKQFKTCSRFAPCAACGAAQIWVDASEMPAGPEVNSPSLFPLSWGGPLDTTQALTQPDSAWPPQVVLQQCGHSALHFDGSQYFNDVELSGSTGWQNHRRLISNDMHWFYAIKPVLQASYRSLFDGKVPGASCLRIDPQNRYEFGNCAGDPATQNTEGFIHSNPTHGEWDVVQASLHDDELLLKVHGMPAKSIPYTDGDFGGGQAYALFNRGDHAAYSGEYAAASVSAYFGEVGEVIVVPSQLTSDEQEGIFSYLVEKWKTCMILPKCLDNDAAVAAKYGADSHFQLDRCSLLAAHGGCASYPVSMLDNCIPPSDFFASGGPYGRSLDITKISPLGYPSGRCYAADAITMCPETCKLGCGATHLPTATSLGRGALARALVRGDASSEMVASREMVRAMVDDTASRPQFHKDDHGIIHMQSSVPQVRITWVESGQVTMVTRWPDARFGAVLSGNSFGHITRVDAPNPLSQDDISKQPQVVASECKGRTPLHFTGSQYFDDIDLPGLTGSNAMHWFLAIKPDFKRSNNNLFHGKRPSAMCLRINTKDQYEFNNCGHLPPHPPPESGAYDWPVAGPFATATDGWQVVQFSVQGGENILRVDGFRKTVPSHVGLRGSTSSQSYGIFSRRHDDEAHVTGYSGEVGEVIVMDGQLSDAQQAQIFSHLWAKWVTCTPTAVSSAANSAAVSSAAERAVGGVSVARGTERNSADEWRMHAAVGAISACAAALTALCVLWARRRGGGAASHDSVLAQQLVLAQQEEGTRYMLHKGDADGADPAFDV